MHALCLPLGASISLLVMFFFFDSMQMLFAVATAGKLLLVDKMIIKQSIQMLCIFSPQ